MSDKLKSVKYNGCYFDRREEEAARLCTTEGWFSCQVSSACSKAEGLGSNKRWHGLQWHERKETATWMLHRAVSSLAGWCRSICGLLLVSGSKRKDHAGARSSTPFIADVLFSRGPLTEMTARVSILSTPTATGKAESSSVPGISITCTYKALIQTHLFHALRLRQERHSH